MSAGTVMTYGSRCRRTSTTAKTTPRTAVSQYAGSKGDQPSRTATSDAEVAVRPAIDTVHHTGTRSGIHQRPVRDGRPLAGTAYAMDAAGTPAISATAPAA